MSRREIRRMLMESKRRSVLHKPWVAGLVMGAVLTAGIGLGAGIGWSIIKSRSERAASVEWEQAEMAVDRPSKHEDLVRLMEPPPERFEPLVPVPLPRPGGPSDDMAAPDLPLQSDDVSASRSLPAPQTQRSLPASPAPQTQIAALPGIAAPPPPSGEPAWLHYAVPSPKIGNRPMIAVVVDDLGVDRKRSEKVVELPAPLTLAWMTYAKDLPALTERGRRHGHELMVHMPMQPQSASYDPGPDVLEVGLSVDELRRRIRWGLTRFNGYVGVNNHMGSRFTADPAGMRVVMEELHSRGLFFLDSLTTQNSAGAETAARQGVPFAARQVFLDNDMSLAAVKGQLARTEAQARKNGYAIAIGHPHDSTIEALAGWLPGLAAKGFVVVPVSTVVKYRMKPSG